MEINEALDFAKVNSHSFHHLKVYKPDEYEGVRDMHEMLNTMIRYIIDAEIKNKIDVTMKPTKAEPPEEEKDIIEKLKEKPPKKGEEKDG